MSFNAATNQKVKIHLHGYLKKLYPQDLHMTGSTVAEIVNGMCLQTRAFNPKPGEDRHVVSVVGFKSKESLFSTIPVNVTELHIVPQMSGGKGGLFKIIIGVVIIAAAFLTGGVSLVGGNLIFWSGSLIGSTIFNFGVSMLLGGLLDMISPAPTMDKSRGSSGSNDPEASKYLGATQNTVRVGTRIPLLYGKFQVFGQYISFDVDAVDVSL